MVLNALYPFFPIGSQEADDSNPGIIYGHSFHQPTVEAHVCLERAIKRLITSVEEDPPPRILWSTHYHQQYNSPPASDGAQPNLVSKDFANDHILQLPDLDPGLALEDDVLKHVKAAYEQIMGDGSMGFMAFEDREGVSDENSFGNDEDN